MGNRCSRNRIRRNKLAGRDLLVMLLVEFLNSYVAFFLKLKTKFFQKKTREFIDEEHNSVAPLHNNNNVWLLLKGRNLVIAIGMLYIKIRATTIA